MSDVCVVLPDIRRVSQRCQKGALVLAVVRKDRRLHCIPRVSSDSVSNVPSIPQRYANYCDE